MKVFDIMPLNNLFEKMKKRKRGKKVPTWIKNTSFRKGPYGMGGFWGGWSAWGGDAGNGAGGGDGGGE